MDLLASVVVVTYNSAEHLHRSLAALLAMTAVAPFEVVVVDNDSEDDSVERVRHAFPGVRLLPQSENLGFAGGVNRGVAAAQGSVIALLNPDAIPHHAWLDHLVAPLDDEQIGVVGGKVLSDDGRIQSVGAVLKQPVLLPQGRGAGEIDRGQYDTPADVWSAHGASMAFRRETWERLGNFDEAFFPAYLEESDFCERARRAGLRVLTAPGAVVSHSEAVSTGKESAQFLYYFLRNRLRYVLKWLSWDELWQAWRPAEQARLRAAPLIQRRVAAMVYAEDSGDNPPNEAERARILAVGRVLREKGEPDDGLASLLAFLDEARENSVHRETLFHSRIPGIAHIRRAWNNVATRWYVRPNLDQQTRYNLALERMARAIVEQMAADRGAAALDAALLQWRIKYQTSESEHSGAADRGA